MVDLVEDLEALHRRMEEQAAKLNTQSNPESPRVQQDASPQDDGVMAFFNSEIGKEAGVIAGRAIGEGLIALVSDLFPKREAKPGERPRSRFLSLSPRAPAVAPPPPPPVAAAPAPAAVPPPAPSTSIDLVGHVPEKPDRGLPDFSAHLEDQKLNLDESPGPRGPRRLRGPIITER